MGYGGGGTIHDGLNVKANHDAIVGSLSAASRAPRKLERAERHHVLRQPPRHAATRRRIDNCVTGAQPRQEGRPRITA